MLIEEFEPLIEHVSSGVTRQHAELELALYNALKKDIEDKKFRGIVLLTSKGEDHAEILSSLSSLNCKVCFTLNGACALVVPNFSELTKRSLKDYSNEELIEELSERLN